MSAVTVTLYDFLESSNESTTLERSKELYVEFNRFVSELTLEASVCNRGEIEHVRNALKEKMVGLLSTRKSGSSS